MVSVPTVRQLKTGTSKPAGNYPSELAQYIGLERARYTGLLRDLPEVAFYDGQPVTEMSSLRAALEILDALDPALVYDRLPDVGEIREAGEVAIVATATDFTIWRSEPDPRYAGILFTSAEDPDEPGTGTYGFSVGIAGSTDFGTVETDGVNRIGFEFGVSGNSEIRLDDTLAPFVRGNPAGTDDNLRIRFTRESDDAVLGTTNAVLSRGGMSGGIRSFTSDAAFPVATAATETQRRLIIERQLADDAWTNIYPRYRWAVWNPPAASQQVEGGAGGGLLGLSGVSPELRARFDPEFDITTPTRYLDAAIGTRYMSDAIENDLHQSGATVSVNPHPAIATALPTVYDRLARNPSRNRAINRTISFDHGMVAESGGQGRVVSRGFLVRGLRHPMGPGVIWTVAIRGRLPSNFIYLSPIDFQSNSAILASLTTGAQVVPGVPNRQLDWVFKEDGDTALEINTSGRAVSGTEDSSLALVNSSHFAGIMQVRQVSTSPDIYQIKYSINGRAVLTSPESGGGAIINNHFAGSSEISIGNGMTRASAASSFKGDVWDVLVKTQPAANFVISDSDMRTFSANAVAALDAGTYNDIALRDEPYTAAFARLTAGAVPLKYARAWTDISTGILTVPRISEGGYLHHVLDAPFNVADVDAIDFLVSTDGAAGGYHYSGAIPIRRSMVRPISEAGTIDAQSAYIVPQNGGADGVLLYGPPQRETLNVMGVNLIGASDGAEIVTSIVFKMDNEEVIGSGGVRVRDIRKAG